MEIRKPDSKGHYVRQGSNGDCHSGMLKKEFKKQLHIEKKIKMEFDSVSCLE